MTGIEYGYGIGEGEHSCGIENNPIEGSYPFDDVDLVGLSYVPKHPDDKVNEGWETTE